jgi:hypothetical protein
MATTDLPGYRSDSDKVTEGDILQRINGSPSSAKLLVPVKFTIDGVVVDRVPMMEGPSLRNAQLYGTFPSIGRAKNAYIEWARYADSTTKTFDGTAATSLVIPVAPESVGRWSPVSIDFSHELASDGDTQYVGLVFWLDAGYVDLTTRISKEVNWSLYGGSLMRGRAV